MQSGRLGGVSYGKTHRKGQLKEAVLFSDISCQGEPSSKGRGKKKERKKEKKKKVPVEFVRLLSRGKKFCPHILLDCLLLNDTWSRLLESSSSGSLFPQQTCLSRGTSVAHTTKQVVFLIRPWKHFPGNQIPGFIAQVLNVAI